MVRSDFNRPFDRWLIGLTIDGINKEEEQQKVGRLKAIIFVFKEPTAL